MHELIDKAYYKFRISETISQLKNLKNQTDYLNSANCLWNKNDIDIIQKSYRIKRRELISLITILKNINVKKTINS